MTRLWLLLARAALWGEMLKCNIRFRFFTRFFLFRGTTGLGIHIVSEEREKGAVVDRYGDVFVDSTFGGSVVRGS